MGTPETKISPIPQTPHHPGLRPAAPAEYSRHAKRSSVASRWRVSLLLLICGIVVGGGRGWAQRAVAAPTAGAAVRMQWDPTTLRFLGAGAYPRMLRLRGGTILFSLPGG